MLALLGALLLVAAVASVLFATRSVGVVDVVEAFWNRDPSDDLYILIRDERIPRTAMAIVVGAAMAVAGAVIQGYTRNPLADPGILGISNGAGFAVVLAVMLFGAQSITAALLFGLVGAAVAAVLVFGVATFGAGGGPMSLVLAGAALTALFVSATSAIVISNRQSLNQFRTWNAGSLVGRGFDVLGPVLPPILVGLVLAFAIGPALNALAVGDDTATALGIRIGWVRIAGFVSITLLTGSASAAVGPIVFVGLVVPHLIRGVIGPDHRWLLPLCVPAGGTLMLVSDIIGRVVLRPAEVPVGVILAFVGVPFFIWFIRRRRLVVG
ncbi:iron ABC transporter permease [Gordonia spumicola]|uniref:Iron ABC transporter permease n=2 Tax=Gordonia spumicola TaxID=589161 RepID=A0A7I9V6V6_9ACTN|nr:iron ABC transporter permease [Gordonia spumicola]